MRKAVVLDKSGTIVDPCRVVLDLSSGKYSLCGNTLQFANTRKETLVNVRGPINSIIKGNTARLSLKVSYCPLEECPDLGSDLLGDRRVVEGLKGTAQRVISGCNSELGVCTALLVDSNGRPTHTVGLGGKLYDEVQSSVRSMMESDCDVFIATGNCREASIACAKLLGIPKKFVLFDADPEEKKKLVKKLRGFYGSVIMVGNDINDLDAMKEADVGIMVARDGKVPDGACEADYVVASLKEVERIVSGIRQP